MTRDEAIEKAARMSGYGPALIDTLVALGLLRVDTPRTVDVEAHECLERVMTEFLTPRGGTNVREVGHLSSYGAGCIRSALAAAGLTIVRREDVK